MRNDVFQSASLLHWLQSELYRPTVLRCSILSSILGISPGAYQHASRTCINCYMNMYDIAQGNANANKVKLVYKDYPRHQTKCGLCAQVVFKCRFNNIESPMGTVKCGLYKQVVFMYKWSLQQVGLYTCIEWCTSSRLTEYSAEECGVFSYWHLLS